MGLWKNSLIERHFPLFSLPKRTVNEHLTGQFCKITWFRSFKSTSFWLFLVLQFGSSWSPYTTKFFCFMTKSSTISLAVSLLFISFFNFSIRLSNSTLSDVVACFFTSSTEHLADTSFSICVNQSLIGFSSFSNLSWSLVSIVENEHLISLFIMSLISLGVIPWVPEPFCL